MFKQLNLVVGLAIAATLVACGGDGGSATQTVAVVEKTFPLQQIYKAYLNTSHNYTVNTNANLAGSAATSTGTRVSSPLKSTTFENSPAFVFQESISSTNFQPGLPSSTTINESYYNANGQLIGYISKDPATNSIGDYAVNRGTPLGFPENAKISDSGNLSVLDYYGDPTKKLLNLNGVANWSLKEGFGGGVATLEIKSTFTGIGATSGVTIVETKQFSLDANNNLILVKIQSETKAGTTVISLTSTLTGK